MACVRLLTLVVALVGCASCGSELPAVVETPPIAGHVIDRRTGEPVEGAEVFVMRAYRGHDLFHVTGYFAQPRWTTTDEEGHFAFPAHSYEVPEEIRDGLELSSRPRMMLAHPDYGAPIVGLSRDADPARWTSATFEIEPVESDLSSLDRYPTNPDWVCSTFPGGAFKRCCEVLYSETDACD